VCFHVLHVAASKYLTVADLYDFATLGAGAFTFTPVDTFQAMPADLERTLVPKDQLKVSVASVEVNVEKDVTKRELRVHAKRARVVCSNSSQSSAISASYTEGKSLAAVAANYISSNGASTLFRAYFGSSSTTTIRSRFTSVANENSSTRTLSCSDPYGACSGGVIAYTLISSTNI
jgi:deuterolysin